MRRCLDRSYTNAPGSAVPRRRRRSWICLPLSLVFLIGVGASADDSTAAVYAEQIQPLLETYCVGCHGADDPEAGVTLEWSAADLDLISQYELWRQVQDKLQIGEMPPEDEDQPSATERHALLTWIESAVAQVDCRQIGHPGRITIRRLNRSEYDNTIRDLIGIDFSLTDDFPADDVGDGFDNIADVLSLPPLLMEKYLSAAETIVQTALESDDLRNQLIVPPDDAGGSMEAAARQTLDRFAYRAFRRPVRIAERTGLLKLHHEERQSGVDYPQSLEAPMTAVLVSPSFLFRIELDPLDASDSGVRQLNSHELASRLSYFLWSTMPDDRLFKLARDGRLEDPSVLDAEARRMLEDPKAEALLTNFVAQWLQLRRLGQMNPDPARFPDFDESLRSAMQEETQRFATSIMRENRSVMEFLDADFSFLNERLAAHYRIDGVTGDEFRRVQLVDSQRGGILTQASILTLTSNPTRTSPVKRGKWILDNILGSPPPPPPPGVEELKEDGNAVRLGSLRERMEQHRSDPSCAVCHTKMDALGFGFENFDAIGAWRDQDGEHEIDPSGKLPGNQDFRSPSELRQILKHKWGEPFLRCLCEKMLTYALGRELQSYDRCAVDTIVKRLDDDGYRFHSLVTGIINSEPFRLREYRERTK